MTNLQKNFVAALLTCALLLPSAVLAQSALDNLTAQANEAWKKRDYKACETLLLEKLKLLIQTTEFEKLGRCYYDLGVIYSRQGKYTTAIESLRKALEIYDKHVPGNDSKIADVARELGENLASINEYPEAEKHMRRVNALDDAMYGPDSPESTTDKYHLARYLYKQSKYDEAEPIFKKAIKIDETQGDKKWFELSKELEYLGRLYFRQGRFAEAEPLYKRALEIKTKAKCDESDMKMTLSYLADLYLSEGHDSEALQTYFKLLKLCERTDGVDSPSVAAYLKSIAMLYQELDRHEDAAPLIHRAIKIVEKNGEGDGDDVGLLAILYLIDDRLEEAKAAFIKAIEKDEKQHGSQSHNLGSMLQNVAKLSERLKDYDTAEKYYLKAVSHHQEASLPNDAITFYNLAMMYQKQNRLAEAEAVFKRAAAIDYKFFGRRVSANLVRSEAEKEQLNLARLCQVRLQALSGHEPVFDKVLPKYEENSASWKAAANSYKSALPLVAKRYGANSTAYADALQLYGFSQSRADFASLVIPDLLKAAEIKEGVLGPSALTVIEAKLQAALYFQSIGGSSWIIADKCYKALLDSLANTIANWKANKQAAAAPVKSSVVAATNLTTGVIGAKKTNPSTDMSETVSACICLASIFAGHPLRETKAKECSELAILLSSGILNVKERIDLLLKVCTIEQFGGRYAIARSALDSAKAAAKSTGDESSLISVHIALGRLALIQSDFETANDAALLALNLTRQKYPKDISKLKACYELLSQSKAGLGDLKLAIQYTREVLKVLPDNTNSSTERATIETQLGLLLTETREYADADVVLQQSLKATQFSKDAELLLQSARTYSALGALASRRKNMQKSADYYGLAVDIFRRNLNRDLIPSYIRALNGSSAALASTGDLDAANADLFTSADITSDYISKVFSQLSFGEQCAFVKLIDDESKSLFALCKNDPAAMEKAYTYAGGWKGLLVESLRSQSELLQIAKDNAELTPIITELNSKRRLLAGLSQSSTEEAVIESKKLESEVEQLEQRLYRESGLKAKDPLPLRKKGVPFLSDLLKPDEALVDVIQLKSPQQDEVELGAAIVTKTGFKFVSLGKEGDIASAVNRWRNSVTGESLSNAPARSEDASAKSREVRDIHKSSDRAYSAEKLNYSETSTKLKSQVWAKITAALPSAAKKIFLVTDASLARVPWNAIAESGTMISEVDSPAEFVQLAQRPKTAPSRPNVVIAGDIAFNDPRERVSELEGTKIEIAEISGLAKQHEYNVKALERENATKLALIDALSDASFVHIATHGFTRNGATEATNNSRAVTMTVGNSTKSFARNPLLDTGIFLAYPHSTASGAQISQEEPGILTASEIIGLNLKSCDLVSLSACQTGLGRDLAGQGAIGLRSAIIAAGSQSVLMSMWKVDDEATQELMHQFYKNLWDGNKSKAESLRLAQESIRTNAQHPQWSDPRYWAAWTLVGQAW